MSGSSHPPDRLVFSSRPFINPDAAREQSVPASPLTRQAAEAAVEAPRLVLPAECDAEEPGVPLESKPDFEITQQLDLWWRLGGVLLLAALPIFIGIKDAPDLSSGETRTIAASQRAADRLAGETRLSAALLVPLKDGAPDYRTPPGTTWAHLTVGKILDPAVASTKDLRHGARLVSALAGLIAVAAAFWCGFSLGGLSTATLAGLLLATMPVACLHFRQAKPEALQTACAMLATGFALWAMRPLRDLPSIPRQAFGWLAAGLCLGAATLVGGPLALPPTLLPLLVIVFVCPHRIGHTLGLLAAVLTAALSLIPWLLFVHQNDSGAVLYWVEQLAPRLPEGGWPVFLSEAGWRLLLVAATLGLWATWLPAALLQPFSTSSRGVRQRMMIGWSWFATLCALLVAAPTPSSDPGTLMAAMPPAAILLAQLLRRLGDLASVGHRARFWVGTRWVMMLLTLALSILVPTALVFLHRHPELVPHPVLAQALQTVSLGWAVVLGCLLLATAALGARFAASHAPTAAVACWAAWSTIAMTAGAMLLSP